MEIVKLKLKVQATSEEDRIFFSGGDLYALPRGKLT